MSDTKISALPAAVDLTGADFPGVQGGQNYKFSTSLFTTLNNGLYQPLSANLTSWSALDPDDYLTEAEVISGYQPLDSDLTAWAAVNPSSYSTTAQIAAAYQPLDADLTAIAGVTTASYGRSLLSLANATALAGEVDSFFLTPAEGNAAYQPLDSDLTSIAALSTNIYGRSLLELSSSTALASEVDSFFLTPTEGNAAYVLKAGDTMTGPLITTASITGAAGLNIPHGTAPSAPNNGDVWTTTTNISYRINGVTRTPMNTNGGTFTGNVVFPAATTSIPSLRMPHGVAPSAPTNGDVWSESATGFWGRVNGTSVNLATVAGVASGYQPLDSDLTSWAGVTRASGFDTFAATPSSANLRALLTDEVGTGAAYFVGGALGTPASATLTNASGLPLSGLVSDTSTAVGVGTVELGHASDTTLSRGASGFLAVEGKRVPSPASQALGDILYRGSTEWERLAAGTALQNLRMNSGATAPEWATAREVLTANRTYYVRTDGSNSNTGLVNSAGGAFLTLQKAWDVIVTLDLAGFTVTVSIGAGTFTTPVVLSVPQIGGPVVFSGAGATTIISTTSATCFTVTAVFPAAVTLQNMKLQTTTGGNCIDAAGAGVSLTLGAGLEYGACANVHIVASRGASVVADSNYTISGGGVAHWVAGDQGQIRDRSKTITLTGTPAFSFIFAYCERLGDLVVDSITFSGSATGTRYSSIQNAVIYTAGAGASYIPGNAAGSTATGGQYV